MARGESLGTLAEEAAKLAAVLATRARQASEPAAADSANDLDGVQTSARGGHADESEAHAAGCDWCPLCRARALVDGLSPDVRQHLTQAATSFGLAVQGLLATATATAAARQAAPSDPNDREEE